MIVGCVRIKCKQTEIYVIIKLSKTGRRTEKMVLSGIYELCICRDLFFAMKMQMGKKKGERNHFVRKDT